MSLLAQGEWTVLGSNAKFAECGKNRLVIPFDKGGDQGGLGLLPRRKDDPQSDHP